MHSKEVIYLKVYKTYLSPGINELEKHLKRYYWKAEVSQFFRSKNFRKRKNREKKFRKFLATLDER